MGLDAVFFDFDGTLADSYPAITASVNHVRRRRGLATILEENVRPFVGHGPEYLMEHTVPGSDPKKCLMIYRRHYPSVMMDGTKLLPGAQELLSHLKTTGKKIALCSNKPRFCCEELLAHLGVWDKFDVVLGPEDVDRPKPAPDMLVEAMKRLRLVADSVLFIGDMSIDIQTARDAGVEVWVVPTGSETTSKLQYAMPDGILRVLYEAIVLID